MIFGIKGSGKIRKKRDNPFFTGNHPELTQNSQNKPIKAGPGNLTSDSEFFSHNPFYRSFLGFKTWHIFLDFNRSFSGIIGNNPQKTANISQIQTVTATPNGYG
jgi:hypothetical protein